MYCLPLALPYHLIEEHKNKNKRTTKHKRPPDATPQALLYVWWNPGRSSVIPGQMHHRCIFLR